MKKAATLNIGFRFGLLVIQSWLLLLLPACIRMERQPVPAVVQPDTSGKTPVTDQHSAEEWAAEDRKDSLFHEQVLRDALDSVYKLKDSLVFTRHYELENTTRIVVELIGGNLFSNKTAHVLIRRSSARGTMIDLYVREQHHYRNVLSHLQQAITYENDTIRDVNGDGLKDFVVNWYGSSGCCLKAFSDVYLQRPGAASFSGQYEFINPTFSRDGTIRGICYGHPGETEMYKYRFRGEQLDTLAYVSFERNNKGEKTGMILLTDRFPSNDNARVLARLLKVPQEFEEVEGYGWFLGTGN